MREVLSLIFEFIITLVILIGGGTMLYYFKGTSSFEAILSVVSAAFGSILAFWFQRRQAERFMNQDRGYLINGQKKDTGGGTDVKTE